MTGTTRTSPRTADASIVMRPPEASAPGVCLNCREPVSLRYCPACGQAAIDPNPTVGEFVHEAASEFLHWDGGSVWSAFLRSSAIAATYFVAFTVAMMLTFAFVALRL